MSQSISVDWAHDGDYMSPHLIAGCQNAGQVRCNSSLIVQHFASEVKSYFAFEEVKSMEFVDSNSVHAGKHEVFCHSYVNKHGKRIYHPTGGVFHFWVDDVPDARVNMPKQLSMFDELEA